REPSGRRRQCRGRRCREISGRRLHHSAKHERSGDQPGHLPLAALRRGAGFHSGDATRRVELVLAASPKLSATSVPELIALAKKNPGTLNYGMTGAGNPLHLTMEMFKTVAGVDIQPVPYKGDAAIFPALITGEIQVAITPMATSLPHVAAGTVRT